MARDPQNSTTEPNGTTTSEQTLKRITHEVTAKPDMIPLGRKNNGRGSKPSALNAASLACLLAIITVGCTENRASSGTLNRADAAKATDAESKRAPLQANHSVRGLIVVLGSSTSAGTGPKDPKNAWVARYKAYLAERFPNVTLVNLAVGGQTTFEIQPTGYTPPPNRPAPVLGKNITFALGLNPSAIIVNLPSNDQANGYPLAEQLANYDRIANTSASAHVELWVSTTQPRNFRGSAQLGNLMQARDAISKKFAPHTLDFWTPFAAPDGSIKATYDSGDGTHLNDAAHAILASIVEAAHIPEQFPALAQ
jgi:lysophospholipase L1-like esterase